MLSVVESKKFSYNNSARITSNPIFSKIKLIYYICFANLYGFMGRFSQVVMVNSSWTKNHIDSIWKIPNNTHIVYPPCDTAELSKIPLNTVCREPLIISIGQFRPEKNHKIQLQAFSYFLKYHPEITDARLILIGGCRNLEDETRINELRAERQRLNIPEDKVLFEIGISNIKLKEWLSRAAVGIHTMWCEHFGIGVVEFMAAGVIPIANNSGGPKFDIVLPGTGYLASEPEEYAEFIYQILSKRNNISYADMQSKARESAARFSEENFYNGFRSYIEPLLA